MCTKKANKKPKTVLLRGLIMSAFSLLDTHSSLPLPNGKSKMLSYSPEAPGLEAALHCTAHCTALHSVCDEYSYSYSRIPVQLFVFVFALFCQLKYIHIQIRLFLKPSIFVFVFVLFCQPQFICVCIFQK